jgi:tyrosine-protein phosphatase YwqE
VFCFDVVHRDLKHVIAADAHAVDLRGRFVMRRFTDRVIRVRGLLFAHIPILSQQEY